MGEDGRVILYKADQTEVVRVIGKCLLASFVTKTLNMNSFIIIYLVMFQTDVTRKMMFSVQWKWMVISCLLDPKKVPYDFQV